jgi:hypothetical protein
MFATNKEVAKLAYKRAKLIQLNSSSIESYSNSNYNIVDTTLVNYSALAKLYSLIVILRDNKFN